MDTRRFLMLGATGLLFTSCATPHGGADPAPPLAEIAAAPEPTVAPTPAVIIPRQFVTMAPIPDPPEAPRRGPASPGAAQRVPRTSPIGPAAIAEANTAARAPSRADGFVGGIQVFAYDPGRVYEVWAAPLRVTLLTLGSGESVVAKAAGDTVRWQIGETTSGEGVGQRTHVLLKPLERGLETNLVLTTNQRVYLVQLRSGGPETFNPAIAWDAGPAVPAPGPASEPKTRATVAAVSDALDARYRIDAKGRRPRWTPASVFNDGTRTFIVFPRDLSAAEAPALFAVASDGERQMINYRQQGGVFVVDQVLDHAELRLGLRRPEIVRLTRIPELAS